jgi:hypothetical protein
MNETEEKWCFSRLEDVQNYLEREGVKHGRVGEWPAWHLQPYVSVWAIESAEVPDAVGWWVISGDLPTDYITSEGIYEPRDAIRSFSKRWEEVSDYMLRGDSHPTIKIGSPDSWSELGPHLKSRADILWKWAEDDSIWSEAS